MRTESIIKVLSFYSSLLQKIANNELIGQAFILKLAIYEDEKQGCSHTNLYYYIKKKGRLTDEEYMVFIRIAQQHER